MMVLATISSAESLLFKKAGFAIDILDDPPRLANSAPVMMTLPAVNGFAANINVLIQSYPGITLDDYRKISEAEFVLAGFKTATSAIKDNVLVFEYEGIMNGSSLHFYSKAVKKGSLFYLTTATDLKSEWPKNSNKLKSVVDSFQLQ